MAGDCCIFLFCFSNVIMRGLYAEQLGFIEGTRHVYNVLYNIACIIDWAL